MSGKVLANVGGTPITDGDVDEFLAALGERGAALNTPEGRARVLQQLIGDKLLLLDAKRNLLEADPAFRAELSRMKDNLLISFNTERVLAGVTVTDAEVEKYYEEHAAELAGGETVNASHILVDSEETAKDIYQKIAGGEMTFEQAAKAYSSCPSREQGGNLGDFGRGQMVPEFEAAAFALQEGEITKEPVKTQFGYHIIRLNSKKEAGQIPLAEIREKLSSVLLREKQQKAYASKINQLKILYPVDTF